MTPSPGAFLIYRQALALNNQGVSLLEKGQRRWGLSILKKSLAAIKQVPEADTSSDPSGDDDAVEDQAHHEISGESSPLLPAPNRLHCSPLISSPRNGAETVRVSASPDLYQQHVQCLTLYYYPGLSLEIPEDIRQALLSSSMRLKPGQIFHNDDVHGTIQAAASAEGVGSAMLIDDVDFGPSLVSSSFPRSEGWVMVPIRIEDDEMLPTDNAHEKGISIAAAIILYNLALAQAVMVAEQRLGGAAGGQRRSAVAGAVAAGPDRSSARKSTREGQQHCDNFADHFHQEDPSLLLFRLANTLLRQEWMQMLMDSNDGQGSAASDEQGWLTEQVQYLSLHATVTLLGNSHFEEPAHRVLRNGGSLGDLGLSVLLPSMTSISGVRGAGAA